ncbi:MAG: prolyl aminopeptidase [Pseudomonadota bacterium]
MPALYPEIEPYQTGYLDEADGHTVYFEVCGNPDGEPVVYLHGGPGSGCTAAARRIFDPARFRIILFDQRGCGRSTPLGRLEQNTTGHLIADMERLRQRLDVERWHVFGGSWGSTLGLAYGMAHAGRVASLTLYGIFLARARELAALYHAGGVAQQLFPEVFAEFLSVVPDAHANDPIAGYKTMFEASDAETRLRALRLWTKLEMKVSRLVVPDEDLEADLADADYVLSHSLIENHYFLKNGFIDGDQLLEDAQGVLGGVPTTILAGRYDIVCPVVTAWQLHQALTASQLVIVPDAGHSWTQPTMQAAILTAANAVPSLH